MNSNTDQMSGVFSIFTSGTNREAKLSMQELTLTGTLLPVGAVLRVLHVFRSGEAEPVELIYAFGLPRDAALRRFRIVGDGFSVESELKETAEAERIYEEGISNGSLSSLARQYRDGVVNLSVGNIRPGETVVVDLEIIAGVELRDDGLRFRFPFTLAPTYHGQARGCEVSRGVGEFELPAEFDNLVLPNWMKDAEGLHRIGFELAAAIPQGVAEIGSPSHAIKFRQESDGEIRVMLAPQSDVPNRDLVLDIRTRATSTEAIGVTGGLSEDGRGHFALLVPSTELGERKARAARLVFVLDRSGSMSGEPINQARQAIEACLGTLAPGDRFGIVAFDNRIEPLPGNLLDASLKSREAARVFLNTVDARGGTELAAGFLAAAKMLGTEGGDVMILTDGQVSGTEVILESARSAGIRIHCLGIGSSSQDRFLTLLARETGGVSRFVTPRERVDLEAIELYASIGQPVASQIEVEAEGVDFAPAPPRTIFAGNPLVLFGETEERAATVVHLSWDGADGRQRLDIPVSLSRCGEADAVRLVQGARLITNLEAQAGKVDATGRSAERWKNSLRRLSRKYGLASQALSLVAVVKRRGDQSTVIPKTMIVPVGMPDQTSFGSYFNCFESTLTSTGMFKDNPATTRPAMMMLMHEPLVSKLVSSHEGQDTVIIGSSLSNNDSTDLLVRLAGMIEPDGGMPGKTTDERWIATALALLALLNEGHSSQTGAFRIHVRRLIDFLKLATPQDAAPVRHLFLRMVKAGSPPLFKDGLRSIFAASASGGLHDSSTLRQIWEQVASSLPGQQ